MKGIAARSRLGALLLALVAGACTAAGGEDGETGDGPAAADAGSSPDARGPREIEAVVRWSWSGDAYWNVDKILRIESAAPSSMWVSEWSWIDDPGSPAALLGIATDADRLDGSTGDTAVFSSWSAGSADGASCGKVDDELGQALGCRTAITISDGAIYRLRVWRLDSDADGQWWGGWIRDESSGMETFIGRLRVDAASTGIAAPSDRVSYRGTGGCNQARGSVAFFAEGGANELEPGMYEHAASFDRAEVGACIDVMPAELGGTDGARVSLGP